MRVARVELIAWKPRYEFLFLKMRKNGLLHISYRGLRGEGFIPGAFKQFKKRFR